MVKILLIALLFGASTLTAVADNDKKKEFTLEELAKGLPSDIINPTSRVVKWDDKSNIILYDTDRKVVSYNIKTGNKQEYKLDAPKVEPSIIEEMRKTVSNPTLSPDQTKIAYTKDNNLYIMELATKEHTALTTDGSNLILNGWASWVYYEEILGRSSRYKAFWWSPDSKKIAYYKFDDSNVSMFPIYNSKGKHGKLTETRYPKAGDENPKVEIAMVDLETGTTTWADFDKDEDQYVGIPFWSANSDKFMIPWMPREQNHLVLYEVSPEDGSKKHIYEERQDTWIDWINQMVFTDKGFYMIRDFDGWEQIYYQSFDGKTLNKLTEGRNWNTRILKLDQEKELIFFSSHAEASTRNDVYCLNLKKNDCEKISLGDYYYSGIQISPDNKHFTANISNLSTPTQVVLVDIARKPEMKVLSDSKGGQFDAYKIALPKLVTIEVDGFTLPGTITLPVNMDKNKKYPVIISIYGGPNSPSVMDNFQGVYGSTQLWANQDVIQVTIDNRSSGHCGKTGMNFIHRSLGQHELNDYIEWVKYLHTLPYIDETKIGITGFSYGGTMTVLALTDGAEYFQYGIAGGGVYDWQLYDTHYTERYMDRPQDNKEGYAFTRVWNRVSKYKGGDRAMLRITHGTSDDNVHMQNTMQLIDALQKENKEFELMLYPGAYHGYGGYQGKHNRQENLRFWYRHLLKKELPEILK